MIRSYKLIETFKFKYICFFIIGLSVVPKTVLLGQEEINLPGIVQWKSLLKSVDPSTGKILQLLYFEKAVYNDYNLLLPHYEGVVNLGSAEDKILEVKLAQCYFEEIPPAEVAAGSFVTGIRDSITVNYDIVTEKKVPNLRYSFIPLRKNTRSGKYERLKLFSIKIKFSSENVFKSNKTNVLSSSRFADNSVFIQGDWHKFQVNKTGVYKITYNELKALGIQNPAQVRIYGNGGSMLPEIYAGIIPDDPEEIPVMMKTGNDGIFNENDYIMFFAEGPVTWNYNTSSKSFSFKRHEFSDNITYFITSAPGGKRILPYNPPSGEPTAQISTFDGLGYHEENLTNLIQSGRTWYGEDFKLKSSYDISFNFPDLVKSDQVNIEAEVLGRSVRINSFSFQQNGNLVGSVAVSPVTDSHLADYAIPAVFRTAFSSVSDNVNVRITHDKKGNAGAEGWLSYLKLQARQNITMHNDQLSFRDTRHLGQGNIVSYSISNANSDIEVWDVTDLHNVKQILLDNTFTFKADADSLHEYIAFYNSNLLTPKFLEETHGKISNQNLHGLGNVDFVVISHSDFLKQAHELAEMHSQHDGLNVAVVTPEQVYNEFSSGSPDPAAIRNFMKMLYDKAASSAEMPKYLLLLGDGSYDNKSSVSNSGNTNYIITYESKNSLSPSYSYVSDDYFGLLDNNENISTGLLDIGIGRFPVQTPEQAQNIINKIKKYINQSSLGDWRNNICFIGDDEDGNLHMEQADLLATYVSNNYQFFNIEKIYLDAYPQVSTATGQRYPDVTSTILSQMNKGALIINYTGHGGEEGLTAEQVLTSKDIEEWNNDLYPLFVTATCEFGRYDDYQKTSAGEKVLLNPDGGGIGLLTTSRVVYASQNLDLNKAFYTDALVKADDNLSFKLGDIVRKTKNGAGSDMNKLCFTLLGDPALSLAYPTCNRVVTDSINNVAYNQIDTVNAYSKVTVCGRIIDGTGQKSDNFNGVLYATVFDKLKNVATLSNDDEPALTFKIQNNVLFRGKVSVKNGNFKFQFILPRDMDYNFGPGKISYYAHDSVSDVSGYFTNFAVGGMTTDIFIDNQGPEIKLYINDTTFRNGGITNEYPTLLARVSDENGINPGGNSIGHDISATIDHDVKQNFILNSYFQTDIDNYRQGSVTYKFPKLTPGRHVITFKIWDIFNNSSQAEVQFNILDDNNLAIGRIYNYPNPLHDYTYFFFEHNQSSGNLNVTVEIFSMTGSKVKELHSVISPAGFTSEPLYWDGMDQNGNKIKHGIYIYRVILRSLKGSAISSSQKLVVTG